MKDDPRPQSVPQPRRAILQPLLGTRTDHGDTVTTASSGIAHHGGPGACVGDILAYPEPGEARIVTGRDVMRSRGQAVVCVGGLTIRTAELILGPGRGRMIGVEYDDGSIDICRMGERDGNPA